MKVTENLVYPQPKPTRQIEVEVRDGHRPAPGS
jgi:hypothetical protein